MAEPLLASRPLRACSAAPASDGAPSGEGGYTPRGDRPAGGPGGADALLDDVLEVDDAEHPAGSAGVLAADDERGAAAAGDLLDDPAHLLLPLGPAVGVVALLGMLQSDLGTTVILCGSVFLLLFVAGVRLRYLSVVAIVGFVGAAAMIAGEAYRRTRFFDAWLNPWADPKNTGDRWPPR